MIHGIELRLLYKDSDQVYSFLITHLYQFFGVLLGCSMQGQAAYPPYQGDKSQYEVHKFVSHSSAQSPVSQPLTRDPIRFMALDYNEMSYFNQQVGLAAASFGVTEEDVAVVGTALDKLFSYRCSAPATVIPEHGEQLQSMCTNEECPLAENATCALYENEGVSMEPKNGTMEDAATGSNTTMSGDSPGSSSTSSTTTPSSSSSSTTPLATGAASAVSFSSVVALVAGLALAVTAL